MIKRIIALKLIFLSYSSFGYSSFEDMANDMASKFKTPLVQVSDIKKGISDGAIAIIDTRELKEYKISKIKTAIYVGYDDFDLEKTLRLLKGKRKILVYCSVGYRSGDITKRLRKKGVNAHNLYGGIFNWVNSGMDLYLNESTMTNKVHGYNKKWGKWLKLGSVTY